ncbi:CRE-ROP-1 protein [Aphelenchoides avenae]|nr:CRE-ROP-1 protein [Aphelenchus avenae]
MVRQYVSDAVEANLQETTAILHELNLTASIHALEGINLIDDTPLQRPKVQIREDEVRNNAGGFVFKVNDVTRIRRFLILGTEGGTYYVQEKELTLDNVRALVKMLDEGRGGLLLREIVEISLAGRAPKQEPTLMALALLCHYRPSWLPDIDKVRRLRDPYGKDKEEYEQKMSLIDRYRQLKKAAFTAILKVCSTSPQLFTFAKFSKMIAQKFNKSDGWGRAMRATIAKWYSSKSATELAMHITTHPQRNGYSHRDLLRLAHPHAAPSLRRRRWDDRCPPETLVYDQLFHYACTGRLSAEKRQLPVDQDEPARKRERCDYEITPQMVQAENASQAIQLINAVAEAKTFKPDDRGAEERCAELIRQHGLVREHVPTELLNSMVVWAALLEKMPMTALIRDLSTLSTLGMISEDASESSYVDSVVAKLTDETVIQKARIHPISVLLAAATYKKGRGMRGSLTWSVNERIEAALDEAFLKAFKNVEPTGKRYCLAVDVSGRQSTSAIDTRSGVISCREASVAMSKVFLETEPQVECMACQDEFVPLPFKKGDKLTDMVQHVEKISSGNMVCARPMLWALKERKKFDVFIVFTTDCKIRAGEVHPFKALQDYRREMDVPDAKLVMMGMTSTDFAIADPTDPGMLDVCGFDAAIPELVRSFVLGRL